MSPSSQYERKQQKMASTGFNVTTPPDMLPNGKYSRLQNVRLNTQLGAIESRPGAEKSHTVAMHGTTNDTVHSARVIYEPMAYTGMGHGDYYALAGCDDKLFYIYNTVTTELDSGFNGDPMSMCSFRPAKSPREWTYIANEDKMVKAGRESLSSPVPTSRLWGIAPPVNAPTLSSNATLSTLSGTYYYRYRYRSSVTGASSNPSPEPPSNGSLSYGVITVANRGVDVTVEASPDPQADLVDIYRFGEALLDYYLVGTLDTSSSLTFGDGMSDADAQTSDILPTDHDQPFTCVGLPLSSVGTLTSLTTGVSVFTRTGGDYFMDDSGAGVTTVNREWRMAPGTLVNINGLDYTLYTQTIDYRTLYIRGDLTSLGAGLDVLRISEPTLLAKGLVYAWGPYNGSIFACGDYLNPGVLYWTNGNDPDSASSINTLEITSPSEPLLGGFTYDGRNYVWTNTRLFVIYPSWSDATTYTVMETACQRGLTYPLAFTTTGYLQSGGGIYFLGRDGVYVTTGGEATCISDPDLTYLFPKEDYKGRDTAWIKRPADRFRMAHADGLVYLDYLDSDNVQCTLVYDTATKGWIYDIYSTPAYFHYWNEAFLSNYAMFGSTDGFLYHMNRDLYADGSLPFACNVRTKSEDFGDPEQFKLLGDATVEVDRGTHTVTVTPYLNAEATALASSMLTYGVGRTQYILDVASGSGELCRNVALDFSWSNSNLNTVLYLYQLAAMPKVEDSVKRCVEWHEFIQGRDDAYVTGIRLWCDTRDLSGVVQTKTVGVWYDQTDSGVSLTVASDGENKLEFSWPQFKGKLGKLLPTDSNRWKVLKWEWIAEAEPLSLGNWDTNWQQVEGGMGYVTGLQIEADTFNVAKLITFQYEREGTVYTPTLLSASATVTWNGRVTHTFSFEPFRAHQLRFYSYDDVEGRLYTHKWITSPEPPLLTNFNANWEDGGYLGAKWLQGLIIDADTQGVQKTLDIETEDGLVYTFYITHNGRKAVAYALPYARVAHKFRAIPRDSNEAWLYGVEWKWERHPESVWSWQTQGTSYGMTGWWHLRDGYISYESNMILYLMITLDNATRYAIILPNTAGVHRKVYVVFPPYKQKLVSWKIATFLDSVTIPILYTAPLA